MPTSGWSNCLMVAALARFLPHFCQQKSERFYLFFISPKHIEGQRFATGMMPFYFILALSQL